MTAIGKYNVSTNTENTLFVVGDGTSSADEDRSDAFRVVNGGSSAESPIPSSVQAKVNGVSDVYLGCPIGTIVMWAGEIAPDGWLLCAGQLIPTTNSTGTNIKSDYKDYEKLFNVIKTTYGIKNTITGTVKDVKGASV